MDDICTGCLCTGRNLLYIGDSDCYSFYQHIINETSQYNSPAVCIRLCWECRASLRRLTRFREQVQSSYGWLMNRATHMRVPNPSLHISRLQIHHMEAFAYPLPIKTETDDEPDPPLECKTEMEEHCEPETFVNGLNIELANVEPANEMVESETVEEKPKTSKETTKKKIKQKKKIKRKVKKKFIISFDMDNDVRLSDADDGGANETEDITKSVECDERLEALEEHAEKLKTVQNPTSITFKAGSTPAPPDQLPERPQCVECGKTFSSRKTYRYHLNVLHRGQNRYPCPECGKVYQWKSNLGRHLRTHKAREAGELHCGACDKWFASVATYRQHLRSARTHMPEADFSFTCDSCGKKFVNKTRLRDHIDWEHLKKIKFKCQICDKPFKCHTSLYVHMQNVHRNKEKKDNLCHVCGKSYQNAAKLKYHIVAMHTTETPYRCRECGAAFGWYSSLYRHLREVHLKMKLQPKKTKKPKKPIPEFLLTHFK